MRPMSKNLINATTIGIFDSQFGSLSAWLDESDKLIRLSFHIQQDLEYAKRLEVTRDDNKVEFVARQIREYQQGKRVDFDLPIHLYGTAFQIKVWNELLKIPFGETISYQTLATRIGNPKASRAVGAANGNNPVSLIIPCHRVIGSNGSLTGYEGGLPIKEKLLAFEKVKTNP
ncbi:methylated-DNA--[protein]-cysteine S-methyltransferase [Jinshanibacter sp. LJY008]|uniref:Methylated-DNA--protein-cysteine methyltransferase n=1 Tax=Limnobaculum eriocheiris TaxID=2897391 RepID=A0A9X1SJR2_9GAMM|nr:methylated-DNA--[protein]-cysteine S-methyltransferase [Limnobaculum eriocheiris]MCD1124444.1 methylated-DNA--[protein]-cysteine S-methyltransferase [Limnobaculum eriocheiris]